MDHGRNICRQLKQLRRDIADQNGIELHQEECTYKGHCDGTCPHCDAELQYIERELARRQGLGKAAIVAGTVLTMASVQTAQAQEPVIMGKPAGSIEEVSAKGTVKGTITDRKDGEPLIACNVVLRKNGEIVAKGNTDFEGNYTIKGVKEGIYSVEISFPGYSTLIVPEFEVRAKGFSILNRDLSRKKDANDDATEVVGSLMGVVPVKHIDIGEPDTGRTPTVIIETKGNGEATGKYTIGGVETQLDGTPASEPGSPLPIERPKTDAVNPLDRKAQ